MPEEYFTEGQAATQGAESAMARLGAAGAPQNPNYAQEEPAQHGGDPPTPQEPQPEPTPQPGEQQAQEESYEFDRGGQRHKLTRREVDYLLNFGLEAYQRAQNQVQAPRQPEAPQQAQQIQQAASQEAKLLDRIERLESQLQAASTERQVEKITRQIEDAVGKVALYKELKDPSHQGLFREMVMLKQYQNPNLSPETAAVEAEKVLSSLLRDRASAYVQGKVQQAEKRVESGGNVAATPQNPMGAKDLFNGNVLKSAMNRIKQMVNS